MSFPSSGSISAQTINTELGQAATATLDLNSTAYRNRVLKYTSDTSVSYADAYEFVLTLAFAATETREPSSGSFYTQNNTDWQASGASNQGEVRWGGSYIATTAYAATSFTTGTTTYWRDSLAASAAEGYSTRYYYRIYRTIFSANGYTNPDVRQLAVNAGWNQSMRLCVVVSSGTIVSSNTTASGAMNFTGSFPNGVILINNGGIYGMGGAGGNITAAGGAGGHAIVSSTNLRVINNGNIAGGGGGGGAGAYWVWNGLNRSTPGSGGASGLTQSAGGTGGPNTQGAPSTSTTLTPSSGNLAGTFNVPGPSQNWGWGGRASSPGGAGGGWGQPGDAGGNVDGAYNYSGYAGGAAGKAISNSGTITTAGSGTYFGATS